MERKKFKELNLSNAFLFAAALADEETCGIVLELILGKKIPKLTVRSEISSGRNGCYITETR